MVLTLAQARHAGMTPDQLRSSKWRRIGYGLYMPADMADDPPALMAALADALPPETVFTELAAACLHGLDVGPRPLIDVVIPPACGVSSAAGVRVRRAEL